MSSPPPSLLRALLPAGQAPGVTAVRARLEAAGAEVTLRGTDCCAEGRWALDVRFEEQAFELWMAPSPGGLEGHLQTAAGVSLPEATIEAAEASDFCLALATRFEAHPLRELHRQLCLLAAAAPDAVLLLDESACTARSGAWLREVAAASTPPSPRALYAVHCVYDEHGVWVHTHGLGRCGTLEVEMLDVPRERLPCLGPLVHAVAAQWIEQGPPPPCAPFSAGRDIELVWVPAERAVAKRKPRGPGGAADRDEAHARPSGVLLVPEGWSVKRYRCPSSLAPILEGNPMLYLSRMETERMALLAAERLGRFAALQARFGEREGWRFLVKLGYPITDADAGANLRAGGCGARASEEAAGQDAADAEAAGEAREHLWFDVHAVEGDRVEATLLNAPYHVPTLACGDRGWHDLALLSDWVVLGPHGQYGPDAIHALEDAVAERPDA